MLRAIIETFLGSFFFEVLQFYEANSLIINTFVVAYGLLMVLSWSNLANIRKHLVSAMVDQMQAIPKSHAKAKIKHVLRDVEIPWERVVGESRFPFVAPQVGLYPRRTSVAVVQALLKETELVREALQKVGVAGDSGDQQPKSSK